MQRHYGRAWCVHVCIRTCTYASSQTLARMMRYIVKQPDPTQTWAASSDEPKQPRSWAESSITQLCPIAGVIYFPGGAGGQPLVLSSWGFMQGGSSPVRVGSSSTLVAGPFPTALSVDAGRVFTLLRCSVRGSPQDPLPVGSPGSIGLGWRR